MNGREWMAIETAPKEEPVLVWDGIALVAVHCRGLRWSSIPGAYTAHPTHWMPIPEPPPTTDGVA